MGSLVEANIDSIKFECHYHYPTQAFESIVMSRYETTITVNDHAYTTHNRFDDFDRIKALCEYIIGNHPHESVDDSKEFWVLSIGYSDKPIETIRGSITQKQDPFNITVSSQLRELSGDSYLWLLDDQTRLNRMMVFDLTIIRHDDELYGTTTLSLSLTRSQQTLVYKEHKGKRLVREYSLHDVMIEQMMNQMGEFALVKDHTDYKQPLDIPTLKMTYSLHVQFDGQPPQRYQGAFRRFDLPVGFDQIIHCINDYMQWLVHTRPLDRYYMDLKENEVIYYEVEFETNGKTYYYTYDDLSLIGCMVMVPTGDDNTMEVAKAVSATIYDLDHVPYPLDKVKKIMGIANLA